MRMSTGKRHPLLLYTRLFAMLRVPALLIAGLCGGLWWFALRIPLLSSDLAQGALLIAAGLCGLLFLYTLVGPLLSYVRCYPKYLLVSTPLYRLAISYSRIRTTRPVLFNPTGIRWSQERFLQPFFGRTILALDLNRYPISEKWLRLWLNAFMFQPDSVGLLFHTKDWMALSRDIDTYRSQWKSRQAERHRAQAAETARGNPFTTRR